MRDDQQDFALLRKLLRQLSDLLHAFQVKSAGRLVKNQNVLFANQADCHSKPLFLSARKGQGMTVLIGGQVQPVQSLLDRFIVWFLHAQPAFRLYAVGKKLVPNILHDHVGSRFPLLLRKDLPVLSDRPDIVFLQTAECAGKRCFPDAVWTRNSDNFASVCSEFHLL